jgi:hypothetical protein
MLAHIRVPHSVTGELLPAAAKSTPPATVSALSLAGVGLQDWVLLLTAIYTVLLIVHLTIKLARECRRG